MPPILGHHLELLAEIVEASGLPFWSFLCLAFSSSSWLMSCWARATFFEDAHDVALAQDALGHAFPDGTLRGLGAFSPHADELDSGPW